MKESELLHYKWGGNASHADVSILPDGKDIPFIVIDHIEAREGEMINGVKKNSFVAIFKENSYTKLPMVLNKTNKDRLLKLAHQDEWHLLSVKNFPVRLTYEPTQLGNGLRISKLPATEPKVVTPPPPPPPQKPNLTAEHPDWINCVNYLINGGGIKNLEVRYAITDEVKEQLSKAVAENGPNAGSGA